MKPALNIYDASQTRDLSKLAPAKGGAMSADIDKERAAFEAKFSMESDLDLHARAGLSYVDDRAGWAWAGWQAARATPSPAPIQQVQQDTARLDWLEQAAESLGGLMLHDGQHPAPGRNGLGLRFMGRTLRQAVDACMPTLVEASAPAGAAKSGDTNPCKACNGEGVIHTGIDEAPTSDCRKCDGSGLAPTVKASQ